MGQKTRPEGERAGGAEGQCPESGRGECLMGEGEVPSVSMDGGP